MDHQEIPQVKQELDDTQYHYLSQLLYQFHQEDNQLKQEYQPTTMENEDIQSQEFLSDEEFKKSDILIPNDQNQGQAEQVKEEYTQYEISIQSQQQGQDPKEAFQELSPQQDIQENIDKEEYINDQIEEIKDKQTIHFRPTNLETGQVQEWNIKFPFDIDPNEITHFQRGRKKQQLREPIIPRVNQQPEELTKQYNIERYQPYRFRSYHHQVIFKDICTTLGEKLSTMIFGQKNKYNQLRKDQIIQKINDLFSYQQKTYQPIFNSQIESIERTLDYSLIKFKEISAITQPTTYSPQKRYHMLEKIRIPDCVRRNIIQKGKNCKELTDRLGRSTSKVIHAFLEKIETRHILPLNLKITMDTLDECQRDPFKQVERFDPQFWTLEIRKENETKTILLNICKLSELCYLLKKEKCYEIKILNLHEEDPRKTKIINNLGPKEIFDTLIEMIPNDIGWIFSYDDTIIKRFHESIKLIIADPTSNSLSLFLDHYYLPLILISQIGFIIINNRFYSNNNDIRIRMTKIMRIDQMNSLLDIQEYFENIIAINSPFQIAEGTISEKQHIHFDFKIRKFTFRGKKRALRLENQQLLIQQFNFK